MDYDPKDLQSTLLYMRQKFTMEVFERKPSRMFAILRDLAPGLRRQGEVLRRMGEVGLLRELYFAAGRGDSGECLRVALKARYWLMDYMRFSVESADYYVNILITVYDMDIRLTEAAPRPGERKRRETLSPRKQKLKPKPPAAVLYAGRTGNRCWGNLRWALDSDGLLTVSGKGKMKDFTDTPSGIKTPWREHLRQIVSVSIESGVTSIGENTFRDCANLEAVRISDSVASVGGHAFEHCANLKSVELPDSVAFIGERAFHGCGSLERIRLPRGLVSLADGILDGCAGLISVEIPDGVVSIGDWAFYECGNLERVRVPDSVASIGWFAFRNCGSLEKASVPEGAQIAPDAFDDSAAVVRR